MRAAIPAPGYRKTRGDRNPPATDDARYWVQLATDEPELGWLDLHGPWPAGGGGVVWKWKQPDGGPRPWEVVAVKKA